MEKTCLWCNRVYKTYRRKQKFCDPKCQAKAASQNRKGKHYSPGTEFRKGHKLSEEGLKKLREKLSNRTLSKEHKEKLCQARLERKKKLGYINSKKTRQKISEAILKNPTRHWLGKKRSQETRVKMGAHHRSMKGSLSPSWKGGPILIKCEICGKEKYYQKWKVDRGQGRFCSNACRGVWVSRTTKGRKLTPDQVRNALRRRTPSGLELKFLHIVKEHSLPYRYVGNGAFFIEQFNPDFINTNHEKVAIEVYAKFHKELDGRTEESWKRKRSRVFKKYGWKVIYFEAKEVSEERVLSKLKGGSPSPS